MSDKKINTLISEIIICISRHIIDNKNGLNAINNEYWLGRLSESEDIKKELIKIIDKYI